MNKNIKPELPGGFQDYLPKDQKIRSNMIKSIRDSFEMFGFQPLDTPAVERREVLTGGDENFDKQIFGVGIEEKNKLALRFDLTVPLARVVSAYPQDIKKPAKLYRFGRVWRGEKPQAGRYREFTQCDADIVGSDNVLSDAESIALAYNIMKKLEVGDFVIRINNRKILNGLCETVGFQEQKAPEIFRSLDKLEKIGWDKVKKELKDKGLNKDQVSQIKEFIYINDNQPIEKCEKAQNIIGDSKIGKEGIEETKKLVEFLEVMKIPREFWKIDFSIVRGLDYYTGIVFETFLKENKELGSVLAGGRYDGLIKRFSNNKVPAVGFSVGLDRLYSSLKSKEDNKSGVMILNFEESAEDKVLETLFRLREESIPSEVYLGDDNTLKGQLSYAVSKNNKVVIIIGEKEVSNNNFTVKNLETEKQYTVSSEELIDKVKELTK